MQMLHCACVVGGRTVFILATSILIILRCMNKAVAYLLNNFENLVYSKWGFLCRMIKERRSPLVNFDRIRRKLFASLIFFNKYPRDVQLGENKQIIFGVREG